MQMLGIKQAHEEVTGMKALKRILTVLLVIAVIMTAIFLAGRYGWKLGGFRACQGASIPLWKSARKP